MEHKFKKQRDSLTCLLIVLGIAVGILNWIFREQVFYLKAHDSWIDLWRLIWVGAFIPIGLAFRSYQMSYYDSSPWFSYLVEYISVIGVASFILFVIFHSILNLNNWYFYLVTPPAVIIMGLNPQTASDYLKKIANLLKAKKNE